MYLSIYVCMYLSIYLSVCLSIFLSDPKKENKESGSSIFEELNKNIFSFAEYILFTLDEDLY